MNGSNPIIIIRRKKGSHGEEAHGGSWKVAYADFVTAIDGFFPPSCGFGDGVTREEDGPFRILSKL